MDSERLNLAREKWSGEKYYVVRAIVLTADGKLLVMKRPANANLAPDKWTLIGGKVDGRPLSDKSSATREHHLDAARRELMEETNLLPDDIGRVRSLTVYSSDAGPNPRRTHTAIVFIQVLKNSNEIELKNNPIGDTKSNTDLTPFEWNELPPSEDWAFGYGQILRGLSANPHEDSQPLQRIFEENLQIFSAMLNGTST